MGDNKHYRITIDVICEPDKINRVSDIKHRLCVTNLWSIMPDSVSVKSIYNRVELIEENLSTFCPNMKTTAIVYEQHQEVARIPIDKIEYIYALVDGIRVSTSIPKDKGYESYEGDEIEFV